MATGGDVAAPAAPAALGQALAGVGAGAGADHFWDIRPADNVLAGANPDDPVGFRLTKPGNVKLGDIAPAVRGGRQQAQKTEVLHVADATPDRGGAIEEGVLRRRARDAELESEHPAGEGSRQFINRVFIEDRLGRW